MFKRFFTASTLILLGSSFMYGADSKLSPDLQSVDPAKNIKVIVQYSPILQSLPVVGAVVKTATPLTTILKLGGTVDLVSDVVGAVVCTLPAAVLQLLAADPSVTYITPDRTLSSHLDYTSAAVNLGAAWKSNLTGAGIGIAIIDSGITPVEDLRTLGLAPRIVYTKDFVNGNGYDEYGHGTHVAGIAGANGLSSKCLTCTRSIAGMAPNASFINLRVLDANGQGSDSALIGAIGEAIRLKNTFNIRVINLSVGRPIFETYKLDPVCKAVEAAWKAGIVVVVAAGNAGRDNSVGNQGYGTIESPANDPYVITVGSMKALGTPARADDLVASYSSKGPSAIDHIVKPDIMAPGNHVVSLLSPGSTLAGEPDNLVPLTYYQKTNNSAYSDKFLMLNGTSMATPVVSGVVADMLQAQPSLTPDQVKARLMKTAYKKFPVSSTAVDPITGQSFVSYYDILTIGAGYLDVAAALANNEMAVGNAMSPVAVYDAKAGKAYLTYDPSSTWDDSAVYSGKAVGGNKAVWGTNAVWGSIVVDANKAVWGNQAVWGNSSESAFKAVWGNSSVWGNKAVWGNSSESGNKAVWGNDASTSDSDTMFTANQP